MSSTPLYLLVGAGGWSRFKTGSWIPEPGHLRAAVDARSDLRLRRDAGDVAGVGWFVAMRLAKADSIDQQDAGNIYMWTAIWSIIGSRAALVSSPTPEAIASCRTPQDLARAAWSPTAA